MSGEGKKMEGKKMEGSFGAHSTSDGMIAIRVVTMGDDWEPRCVHHIRTIEEAYLIAIEILQAIHTASEIKTGLVVRMRERDEEVEG